MRNSCQLPRACFAILGARSARSPNCARADQLRVPAPVNLTIVKVLNNLVSINPSGPGASMKLLFVTPPMGNWAPWGERHLAVNSLYSQLAAFVREKKAAHVEVLDCRALGLTDDPRRFSLAP
jgi:hypothetical protein